MSKTASLQLLATSDGGEQFTQTLSITSNGGEVEQESTIPAAKGGTLTTRTDANTGEMTLESGHGITDSDVVDVYWSGGSRRGMTVGTVASLVVPIDGGSGDDLPAQDTVVATMIPVTKDFVVTGDNVEFLAVKSPVPGAIVLQESGPTEIAAATYLITEENGGGRAWISGGGVTNPLASKTTINVKFSHGSLSEQVMHALAQHESS